jgi:hypothetical protein
MTLPILSFSGNHDEQELPGKDQDIQTGAKIF